MSIYFTKPEVLAIEEALLNQKNLDWARLSTSALDSLKINTIHAGWRIGIPNRKIFTTTISYVHLLIDEKYPNSQPFIITPQLTGGYIWPHIDMNGLLCLKATRLVSDPGQRILQHLAWTDELLSYDESECRQEFGREFSSYWSRCSNSGTVCPKVFSLIKIKGKSRPILYFNDKSNNQMIIADNEEELKIWLDNRGISLKNQDILTSWLSVLYTPWVPNEYPSIGVDVLKHVPSNNLRKMLIANHKCPVFFEARTSSGSVVVGVLLKGKQKKELLRGFRHINQVPLEYIVQSFSENPVQRCTVTRVDGAWIHGRDQDDDFPKTHNKKIAVVGCGSLGSMLVRLLAQSGIGNFILIDEDYLKSANISRHALGMRYIGKNKSLATAKMLQEDFPHIKNVKFYQKRFENLSFKELETIEDVDLIISAGIDFDGDANIDAWRRNLSMPPAHLCTWVEAFAIVGHAILLYGKDSLLSGFDEFEKPAFRVSDWPEGSNQLIVEAGCGNLFQPHGFVDLQPTIMLAAKLVLDVFDDKIPESCHRSWQGDIKIGSICVSGSYPNSSESKDCKAACPRFLML
ncbi:ThiF family adenylyltransferase [Thiothrix nivea]|uniref:UBA/THIF-type NAD/FAD binding protein n=1 Tax=Thiothrix nivea (strain ATCC 35100 / DSM 5205 / JP2) TaxID=870187 RepID=A0A656HDL0_THINJ|nr:ThiF family adenylyltransferase [Thiothrix nivea]EIJ34968.1 UBA/THIF-type NAD/FAD binding protein [Thiothrix nivea DSM 5205]